MRLTRSSTVISCTGCMNRVIPGTRASSGCKRRMTSLALILRSSSGFRLIRMRPLFSVVLVPSIPINEDRLSTAGSFKMILPSCLLLVGHFRKGDRLRGFGNALDDARILNREETLGNVNVEHRW